MAAADLCQRYLAALMRGDLEALRAVFTDDAEVVSPLYGRVPAEEFHRLLLADMSETRFELCNLFTAAEPRPAGAMHLRCLLGMGAAGQVEFEAVDMFELTADGRHFQSLTIIYDCGHVREAYARLNDHGLAAATAAAVLGRPAAAQG